MEFPNVVSVMFFVLDNKTLFYSQLRHENKNEIEYAKACIFFIEGNEDYRQKILLF